MGDFQQRWDIAKVLINLGTVVINPLIDILEEDDAEDELRWFAAKILGELQHPEAIMPLVELLKITKMMNSKRSPHQHCHKLVLWLLP